MITRPTLAPKMSASERINISGVTSSGLRDGQYSRAFPEYYDLAKITENGLWHANQNVLDHVIRVFEGLETVLQFRDLDTSQKKGLDSYLSAQLGNLTRKDVLVVSTLLHDIAKVDTLVKKRDGGAYSPGHELIGAGRVPRFADRFGLNPKDTEYVERIIRYHGFTADILELITANGDKKKYFEIFKETVGDVKIELILLMQADLLGSDLGKNDKEGYEGRLGILSWMLSSLT